ncbi:hypothetical protein [Paenibacillus tuaregi]|uniref:hypothetical protein n=1 Tax=Paenibacillus tuaregi TaxID=1816681 RepID=UPI000837B9D9|nr:hypothetical protein [Paenibacillus tuaregi]
MKLKKSLAVLLTSLMLLTVSQSAFAAEVTPYAVGVGDTKTQAITIPSTSENFSLFLSNSEDKDWYKWTNTTGKDQYLSAFLAPVGNQNAFRLGLQIAYTNGLETSISYPYYSGPGNSQSHTDVLIPNGATAYLIVDSTKFVLEQYNLYIRIHP